MLQKKVTAVELSNKLVADGHTVSLLTGDLQGNERDMVMEGFRKGDSKVLISTNVLARGIDVLQVYIYMREIFSIYKIKIFF